MGYAGWESLPTRPLPSHPAFTAQRVLATVRGMARSSPTVRGAGRAVSALAIAGVSALVACLMACQFHDPRYARCRESCRVEHDRCVVDAMNGAALQQCDQGMSACLEYCSH